MMTAEECVRYVENHLVVKPAKNNGAYISGRSIIPSGCVNHSIGVAQPSVDSIYANMNQPNAGWGVNAILGDFHNGEGKIYLTLDWYTRPWGCGAGTKGSYNNTRVQWEVCEPAGHTYSGGTMINYNVAKNQQYFDRMWKMLVAWNVYCVLRYDYPVSQICDHSESYKAGYGTNHADMMHWLPKHGKSMDLLRDEVTLILNNTGNKNLEDLQGTDLIGLTEKQVVDKVGPLFTAEEKRSGILAAVIFAQWILESGYGSTELAKKANNFFGMKEVLSGNTWPGSTWDGKSVCEIRTKEYQSGKWITISAKFRKYPSVKESIADHSAYLLGAMNGKNLRYDGLKDCKNHRTAAQIIKRGGYATDPDYVNKLLNIIDKWNLKQYNYNEKADSDTAAASAYPATPFGVKVLVDDLPIYTSVKADKTFAKTGAGTFTIVEVSAGYGLLLSYQKNRDGWIPLGDSQKCRIVDAPLDVAVPFFVRVEHDDLYIYKGPGITYPVYNDRYTGAGTFTIVEVKAGTGSEKGWGLLKSYQSEGNGWISLDCVKRV